MFDLNYILQECLMFCYEKDSSTKKEKERKEIVVCLVRTFKGLGRLDLKKKKKSFFKEV